MYKINIRCETCGIPLFHQMPGQYSKVCFRCYSRGLFFELTGFSRRQLKAARKHGCIENWKNRVYSKIVINPGYSIKTNTERI